MDMDTGDGWLVRPEWPVPATNVVVLRLWWAEPYNGLERNNHDCAVPLAHRTTATVHPRAQATADLAA